MNGDKYRQTIEDSDKHLTTVQQFMFGSNSELKPCQICTLIAVEQKKRETLKGFVACSTVYFMANVFLFN